MSWNTLKTALLLGALTILLVLVGRALGGEQGMVLAFLFSVMMNFGAYWFSDKLALAMAGTREVDEWEAPELHRLVRELSIYAAMPKPRVYLVDSPSPNAFATGRGPGHAAVVVTTGILRLLDREELAGVMAHELAHIKSRDVLISCIAATLAGAVTLLADFARWAFLFGHSDEEEGGGIGETIWAMVALLVAPFAAVLLQLAISRSREFEADAVGAKICGDPLWLASALEKLHLGTQAYPMHVNPAAASLFIVNPFSGSVLLSLFSTHPPIEERISRLRAMRPRYAWGW